MRPRVGREDVEDHLGAVDHLDLELLLEVAGLGGAQVVVEDDDVGLLGLDERLELLDLARADVGRDVDLLPLLQQAAHDLQTGRLGQSPELVQGIVRRRCRCWGRMTPTRMARSRRPERSMRLVSIKAEFDLVSSSP